MYIDFHTHLDWYKNPEQLVSQLIESGIFCVAASVDAASFEKNCLIAEKVNKSSKYKNQIIPTFGIHPEKVLENLDNLQGLSPLMNKSPIIGEIGIDMCWYKDAGLAAQEKVFRFFMEHCSKNQKYCVIHTKDAEQNILDILSDYPDAKPVIHWYDGPENIFKEMINRGYYFTFGCETIRSSHIQDLLKITPLDRLLFETDNPDSEPWLGGTDNSIFLIKRIYSDAASILKMDESKLSAIVQKNYDKIIKESGIIGK